MLEGMREWLNWEGLSYLRLPCLGVKECVTQVTCQDGWAALVLASCMTWRSLGWSLGLSVGCLLHGWYVCVQAGHNTWLGPVMLCWSAGSSGDFCIWSLVARHLGMCSGLLCWLTGVLGCTLSSLVGLHQVWFCRFNRHCCISSTHGLANRNLFSALWALASCVEVFYVPWSVGYCLACLLPSLCGQGWGKLSTGWKCSGHRNC